MPPQTAVSLTFAIHLLRLDRLGYRVHELIRLPEVWVLVGELDPLFDEGFAVDILVVDLIGADARLGGAVGDERAGSHQSSARRWRRSPGPRSCEMRFSSCSYRLLQGHRGEKSSTARLIKYPTPECDFITSPWRHGQSRV